MSLGRWGWFWGEIRPCRRQRREMNFLHLSLHHLSSISWCLGGSKFCYPEHQGCGTEPVKDSITTSSSTFSWAGVVEQSRQPTLGSQTLTHISRIEETQRNPELAQEKETGRVFKKYSYEVFGPLSILEWGKLVSLFSRVSLFVPEYNIGKLYSRRSDNGKKMFFPSGS